MLVGYGAVRCFGSRGENAMLLGEGWLAEAILNKIGYGIKKLKTKRTENGIAKVEYPGKPNGSWKRPKHV